MSPQELQRIGLTEKEANIFRCMLDSPVDGMKLADIASKLNLDLKYCASYLTNMERKGFVTVIKKTGNRKRYFAGDPIKMNERLDEEMEELRIRQQIIRKLTNRYYQNRILKVDLFEGKEDYNVMREMVQKTKSQIYMIDNSDERWNEVSSEKKLLKPTNQYVSLTISKREKGVKKTGPLTTYHLPPEINIHGDLTIAGDMIIITQPSEKYIGAVITHKQTADNLRAIIELALPQVQTIAEQE